MTRCSNLLSVLVEELDDHQGSLQKAVSDVGWKTVETPDLPWPEEAPAPAPDHLLVAVPRVRHHGQIWNQEDKPSEEPVVVARREKAVRINKRMINAIVARPSCYLYQTKLTVAATTTVSQAFPALHYSNKNIPNYFFLRYFSLSQHNILGLGVSVGGRGEIVIFKYNKKRCQIKLKFISL